VGYMSSQMVIWGIAQKCVNIERSCALNVINYGKATCGAAIPSRIGCGCHGKARGKVKRGDDM
jgi:hypothetical protein